jgi:hypothetical protein
VLLDATVARSIAVLGWVDQLASAAGGSLVLAHASHPSGATLNVAEQSICAVLRRAAVPWFMSGSSG